MGIDFFFTFTGGNEEQYFQLSPSGALFLSKTLHHENSPEQFNIVISDASRLKNDSYCNSTNPDDIYIRIVVHKVASVKTDAAAKNLESIKTKHINYGMLINFSVSND